VVVGFIALLEKAEGGIGPTPVVGSAESPYSVAGYAHPVH